MLAAAPTTVLAQGASDFEGGILLDPITVTATRQTRQLLDVPGTVTVIGLAGYDCAYTIDAAQQSASAQNSFGFMGLLVALPACRRPGRLL